MKSQKRKLPMEWWKSKLNVCANSTTTVATATATLLTAALTKRNVQRRKIDDEKVFDDNMSSVFSWYGMYLMCRVPSCPSFYLVCFNIQIHYANLRFSLLYNLFNILIMTWLLQMERRGATLYITIEKKNERMNAVELEWVRGWTKRNIDTFNGLVVVALLCCYLSTSFYFSNFYLCAIVLLWSLFKICLWYFVPHLSYKSEYKRNSQ